MPSPRLAAILAFLLALALPFVVPGFALRVLDTALIAAIAVLGLNFAFGWAGLISLSQAGFVGVGAYVTALLSTNYGLGFWTAGPVAIAAVAALAAIIGLPMLRSKGHYLALATLGFSVSFEIVAKGWKEVLGGTDGIAGIPSPMVFGIEIDTDQSYFYLLWASLAVATLIAVRIRASHIGRAMIAVRDDEIAAGSASINVVRVKVQSFALGAAYAGAAGVLFAHFTRYVAPEDFNLAQSISYLAMLIVGGEGSILGAIIGAVLITFLPEWLRFLGAGYLALFGTLMVVILIFLPKGLVSLLDRLPFRKAAA